MEKDTWVSYFHKISDENPQHHMCDPEWCAYLKAKMNNTVYKHKPPLSSQVQEYVRPVYEKLPNNDLLKRCLGKNTQNNNECYNKIKVCRKKVTELAVHN